MRSPKTLILVVAALAASSAAADDFVALLPKGVATADVMVLMQPPRAQELSARLQSAMAAEPEWFKAYVAKAPQGEALPYNSKFGISESEYREFLDLASKQTLSKQGEVRIAFRTLPDGSTIIEAPDLDDLNGAAIGPKRDRATTSYGVLDVVGPINNQDSSSPTGAWEGIQWSAESVDSQAANGIVAKLALGQRKLDGRLILYFRAKQLENSKLTRRSDVLLILDARAGSA